MSEWKTGGAPKAYAYTPSNDDTVKLPRLFLCKCLTLDSVFGYKYTYRIGFVTKDKQWNIDKMDGLIKVVAYQFIEADESDEQLMKDIKKYEHLFVDKVVDSLENLEKEKRK